MQSEFQGCGQKIFMAVAGRRVFREIGFALGYETGRGRAVYVECLDRSLRFLGDNLRADLGVRGKTAEKACQMNSGRRNEGGEFFDKFKLVVAGVG